MSKKIQVTFSDTQLERISSLKGDFGDSDSEVIRTVVISWLLEHGLIKPSQSFSNTEKSLNDDK